jgi:AcrR family transcriptional regulator
MSIRTTDTKEEILRLGKQLIQSMGFNAFSYADISKQLNIKNAAVHYHFPGKQDLLSGLLDNYIQYYTDLGTQLNTAKISSLKKLEQFIAPYSQLVDCSSICIIGSVASDYNTLPEMVKVKILGLINLVIGLVEQTLKEGKNKGELSFEEPARVQALLIMTNLAAGVQLARITGKKDFDAIRKALLKQLKP